MGVLFLLGAAPAEGVTTVDGIASSLVGAPVTVACVNLQEQGWWGAAAPGVPYIELDNDVCTVLAAAPRLRLSAEAGDLGAAVPEGERGSLEVRHSGAVRLALVLDAADMRRLVRERED